MPKLIPMPVVMDLLDGGPVVKLVLAYQKGKRGYGCKKCVGVGRTNCASILEAAAARGEKSCLNKPSSYYVLRPLKKSEMR